MERSPVHSHVIPDMQDWPVNKLYSNRKAFVKELAEFTIKRLMKQPSEEIRNKIARAAYLETIRIKNEPWKADLPDEMSFWKKIKKELSDHELDISKDRVNEVNEDLLKKIVYRYSEEIVGGFKPSTFKFARRFLTQFFKVIFNTAWSIGKGTMFGNRKELQDRIKVYGYVDELRSLMNKGSVILVPTHFSNLDSIMVGYALDQVVGVPPFTYGAGLNLYNNKIVGRYMNRLGAYRVDRRKKNKIYLETLKAMSNLAIQKGTNCLFFPGGTRSRSGQLETKLKLGLLGSAVEAQRVLLQEKSNKKVFIVPLIIGYHFVLEANSLIHQYLKSTGEELFIPPKSDESRRWTKIIKFAWRYFSKSSEITLSIAPPLDVLGNRVNKNGDSIDNKGNTLDISGYFMKDGQINGDFQRESEYTRRIAKRITEDYHEFNIVMSSHIVAYTAFLIHHKNYPHLDIYALLRLPETEFGISFNDFCEKVDLIKHDLIEKEKEGKVNLSEEIHWDTEKLVKDGIGNIGLYHDKNPLGINKDGNIYTQDFHLLYYYYNRLNNFDLSL